jgi:hypothetical protein
MSPEDQPGLPADVCSYAVRLRRERPYPGRPVACGSASSSCYRGGTPGVGVSRRIGHCPVVHMPLELSRPWPTLVVVC